MTNPATSAATAVIDDGDPSGMHPIVVIKVGGSLLGASGLGDRLRSAIDLLSPCRPLLVVGGGAAANVVRRYDERVGLPDADAHWLAIQAMDLNAAFLQRIVAGGVIVANRAAANDAWDNGQTPLLQAGSFLDAEESRCADLLPVGECLPRSWDVTSDSIAAWVARQWPAQSLVLLKSTNVPDELTVEDASIQGFVDPFFARIAHAIDDVSWIDLQADQPALFRQRYFSQHRDCRSRHDPAASVAYGIDSRS